MATELDTIRSLYRYNSQVRQKYLRAIWALPPKERHKDRGASFPSLIDIYMHVLDAYRWWFLYVYGGGTEFAEYPLGKRYTLAEAKRETRSVDNLVGKVLRSLREKDLPRRIPIPKRKGRQIAIRVLLLHMMEEELQHRGEMNALLWQAGKEAPVHGFDDN